MVGNSIGANSLSGIWLNSSSDNAVNENELAENNDDGIYLSLSYKNSISENIVVSNKGFGGIRLVSSSGNSIARNNITANNPYGIKLENSSDNWFYHNNLVNNTNQVNSHPDSTNVWDDGYPSGGNYWSDYTTRYPYATEISSSGTWNTSYTIGQNDTDHYPLVGTFSDFNAGLQFSVQIVSNSSISDFQYNGTAISFDASGENGMKGFCRIAIPSVLLTGVVHVFVNDTEVPYDTLPASVIYSYLYFSYTHSTEQVVIFVEEFPTSIVMSLFMAATLLVVIACKRKHAH